MNSRVIIGMILLGIGIFTLFLAQGNSIGTGALIGYLWPSMFVIPLGLFFHWLYFFLLDRRGVGVLIPGGILITAGIVCQIASIFDSWSYMWPGFIFAVAVGLFEFYFFGNRNKWLLIPINILTVLSVLFFIVFGTGALLEKLSSEPLISLLFIAGGAVLMAGARKKTA